MNTTLRSILVPLDGSLLGEQALPIACEIARRCAATLRLVHVQALSVAPIHIEGMPVIDENLAPLGRDHVLTYLEQIRTRLMATDAAVDITEITVEVEFVERPVENLMNEPLGSFLATYAAARQTDLVVMTTHGRGGLGRFWLGSVADTLVRLSQVPILLLRPQDGASTVDMASVFKQVLIPLDGSELAEQVMASALAIGSLTDAAYTLLRVVEPLATTEAETHNTARVAEAKAYLKPLAQSLATAGKQVHTRVILAAQPAPAILNVAQQEGSDLIALATHGRSGLRRLLIGSVADKVLRAATVPVLIYRPHQDHADD